MTAIAPEGNVDVVAEKTSQRNVPSAPELGDASADVGMRKVFVEVETQATPHTDGHIAITREVKIDLEGESQDA